MKKKITKSIIISSLALIGFYSNANAQTISTVAGNGTPGSSGDNGVPTSAQLYFPKGVCTDTAGNIYIADYLNHKIRKVTKSTGKITTIAGLGTPGYFGEDTSATKAKLNLPTGVFVDNKNNVFIVDKFNHRIRKITASTGKINTVAGGNGDGGPATSAQLNPNGVFIAANGNFYFSDNASNSIRKVTATNGIITTIAGNGFAGYSGEGSTATLVSLSQTTGVFVGTNGNTFIADTDNHRIRKVLPSGVISTVAGNGTPGYSGEGTIAANRQLNEPKGITGDGSGNVYFADQSNHRIRKVSAAGSNTLSLIAGNGTQGFSGDGDTAKNAQLNMPNGVCLDAATNRYISDAGNYRIRKVTIADGKINTIAGNGISGYSGDGGLAINAQISTPYGVSVDAAGNVYIADYNNHRIRKVTASTGIISTIAGNGTPGFSGDGGLAASAQLNFPNGVSCDAAGNVYISDGNNLRIRKVNASDSTISTVAGFGTYLGDGGQGKYSSLYQPAGVFVDTTGNIFIADMLNNRIRKVTESTGIISTIAGTGDQGFSGDGGAATAAQLNWPIGVSADALGNVIITDTYNNRIRKINEATGFINTIAGTGIQGASGDGGAATTANLNQPSGVFIDTYGNVYFADDNRIRKVSISNGIISTIVGIGTAGYSGDGGPATGAELYSPSAISADVDGNIYIADYQNHVIRKVTGAIIGITENEMVNNGISIYPNPATDNINISGIKGKATLKIYDILGNLVMEKEVENNTSIDTSLLAQGVYTLVTEIKNGRAVNMIVINK